MKETVDTRLFSPRSVSAASLSACLFSPVPSGHYSRCFHFSSTSVHTVAQLSSLQRGIVYASYHVTSPRVFICGVFCHIRFLFLLNKVNFFYYKSSLCQSPFLIPTSTSHESKKRQCWKIISFCLSI